MQARNENTHLKNNIKNIYYFIWLHWVPGTQDF